MGISLMGLWTQALCGALGSDRCTIAAAQVCCHHVVSRAQGVPIEGEAGVGYRMRAGYDLPPLMFDAEEAKALVASVRLAQPRLDAELAQQAEAALSKIVAVLPPAARAAAESLALFAPMPVLDEATRDRLLTLRRAAEARTKLRLHYRDLQGEASARIVRPLGCFLWDRVWTLAAWCELRQDFRSFRIDRIVTIRPTGTRFRDEPGRTLADLCRLEEARAERHRDAQ